MHDGGTASSIIRVRVEAWVDTSTEETDYPPQNGKSSDEMTKKHRFSQRMRNGGRIACALTNSSVRNRKTDNLSESKGGARGETGRGNPDWLLSPIPETLSPLQLKYTLVH